MRRCDVEVIPNLNQFHVRPLAVGATAPASVFNRGLADAVRCLDSKPPQWFSLSRQRGRLSRMTKGIPRRRYGTGQALRGVRGQILSGSARPARCATADPHGPTKPGRTKLGKSRLFGLSAITKTGEGTLTSISDPHFLLSLRLASRKELVIKRRPACAGLRYR